mgnify:CR=1 FL=1
MYKFSTFILMFVCLSLGILIGFSAKSIFLVVEDNQNNTAYEKKPRTTINVQIKVAQRELLFGKMQRFAEEQGFAIRIAPTSPSGEDYIVEMWREDIKIIALNSFDPGVFRIGFFDTDSAISTPEWALNSLVSDFKGVIDDIPGVLISDV